MATVNGLHHVTAISGDARGNLAFYRDVLGLRFIKKTVNFDDPSVYHLYYGDELGRPGTAMTFFPFEGTARGRRGVGETSETAFAVPEGSLDGWGERLAVHGIDAEDDARFGERRLVFTDPEGVGLALTEAVDDPRRGWAGGELGATAAVKGFHGVTLSLMSLDGTAAVLTDGLGYVLTGRSDGIVRFASQSGAARHVDVVVSDQAAARSGAGSVHHVAFSVPDAATQAEVARQVVRLGMQVTSVIDRDYFAAIYFRTPGGVLFEVSTDGPGFTVDEPAERLGSELKLPKQHEHLRARLERSLPTLA
ncbi:MAG: VOC family protein [Pseudomonadota bacterium]